MHHCMTLRLADRNQKQKPYWLCLAVHAPGQKNKTLYGKISAHLSNVQVLKVEPGWRPPKYGWVSCLVDEYTKLRANHLHVLDIANVRNNIGSYCVLAFAYALTKKAGQPNGVHAKMGSPLCSVPRAYD